MDLLVAVARALAVDPCDLLGGRQATTRDPAEQLLVSAFRSGGPVRALVVLSSMVRNPT